MKCPKCATDAPDSSRFCPRCHATLSFECPSCLHKQAHGGKCDTCGVDFLKYASAMMSAKKAEADATHDRSRQRSTFVKDLVLAPLTGGLPLIRRFFGVGPKDRAR